MVGTNPGLNSWNREGESKSVEDDGSQSPLLCVETTTTTDQPHARRRAQSVASAHPSVETVVSKAKRAASTLWTLLHAQHCTLARGCAHTGCKEAKLLLLHLKMCPAGNSFDCPTKHRGCEQGRKLLAHYKRCKSIRAKQLAQSNMRRDAVQQHVCLVCSLVARQARSVLDIKPPSRSNSTSSGSVASASSSATVRKMASRRVVSSFMLDSSNRVVQMPSPKMMPPPPPRAKGPSDADLVALGGQSHGSSSHHNGLPSPPGSEVKPVKFSDCGNHQYYPLVEEKKSVSFDSGSRDRSLSHSDSHKLAAPSQLFSPHEQRRPRSQSVGPALSGGAHTHAECDTILEEGEGKYPNYNMWNRSA